MAALLAVLAASAPAAPADGAARDFLIRGVRVFDGSRVLPSADVLVRGGKIAAVDARGSGAAAAPGASGATTPAAGSGAAEVIDGRGKTLLPGLIDAHVHTFPGSRRQAIVFGVTTELDLGYFLPGGLHETRQRQAAGEDRDLADLFTAGILATAPGGHGTEYGVTIPTIGGPAEAQSFVDARLAEGSDFIKIIYDDGKTYGLTIPTLSKETLAALIAAAHRRGKLAVVHIGSAEGAHDAIAAGADGLAHLFVDRTPDPDFGRFVAAHHAFVVPTLSVLAAVTGRSAGAGLVDDPRLSPYLDAAAVGSLKRAFNLRPGAAMSLDHALQAVRQLTAAHVPVLAGTDAPNPGTAHGASLHAELELLVKAGMSPADALAAATAVPAAAFRLDDRGRIAPGLRADLVLVEGDPTADITATRAIARVWKLGTPVDREAYRTTLAGYKAAPPGSESGKVSDFEDGTLRTAFGSGWAESTDQLMGGKSQVRLKVMPGGAPGSEKGSLAVTGTVAPGLPFAWAGAMFAPGAAPMAPASLSAHKAIHFWAKGDGKTYRLMVFTAGAGYTPATRTFVAGPEWKELTFPFSDFKTDGHDLMGLLWAGGPTPGDFSFQIDEVSVP